MAIARLGELGKLQKVQRTRDLPVCNIVPHPTTLPRTPEYVHIHNKIPTHVRKILQNILQECLPINMSQNMRLRLLSGWFHFVVN
jgi:hypothetical protein